MKTKRKILSVLTALILVVYPLSFAVTTVYALPELPGTPELPSTPTLPGTPDTPTLPGQEEQLANPTNSGTNDDSDSHHHHDGDNSVGDPSSSNSNTGSDSTNNADTSIDNNSDTTINNDADVDNVVSVDSLSGDNSSDENTGDGTVTSGNAGINGSLQTSANSVSLGGLECSTECEVINLGGLNSSNSSTGSGSDNDASTNVNNSNSLGIDNNADFNNLVDFDANSGDNSASKNTGNGIITTGDSEVVLTAINTANDVNVGVDVFNVYDDYTGDIVLDYNAIPTTTVGGGVSSSNDTTGADSTNNASSDLNNTNTILIDNLGNVINNYQIDANTGNNNADMNTGDGSITTGNANVVFNLINLLNNTFLGPGELLLGIVNIFGNLSGDIVLQGLEGNGINPYLGSVDASNNTTGADSSNNASNSLTNNTDIDLTNSAQVLNNISLDATTGNNDASKNTGSGSITTGDVDANLKVTNIANTNTVGNGGGTIWLVLVNNLGTWTGQLFGGDASSGVYSPFLTFTINPDGSISANNQNTGADSTNNASATVANDTDISVNNAANLTNNVTIDANTGGNSASKNTGSGAIQTGDVNVAANIVNLLNNNFIGGRFVLTIVNIFGGFFGDIRQGSPSDQAVAVGTNESVAISPTSVSNSPSGSTVSFGQATQGLASSQGTVGTSSDQSNGQAIVLGTDDGGPGNLSIARFSTDPGLFDGFKLVYLLIPIFIGSLVSIIRRAIR